MVELPVVSGYLVAAGAAFALAQGIKYCLGRFTQGNGSWRQLYMSGRMPSGHTATMFALMTVVGAYDGIESGLFAVTAVLTLITAYDSVMSRRSVGEQGDALRKLLAKSPFAKDPLPYAALGHKPLEVAAGALLGTGVGVVVAFFITK